MADTKITALTELAERPAVGDLVDIVDISDTTMSAGGTNKKVQMSNILGREKLASARTYYVRTDGNDSNTGLVNNAGGAFLTLQKAYDTFATLDLGGVAGHTIKLGNTGTWTAGISAVLPLVGGSVIIEGDTSTPANTLLSVTSANGIDVACASKLTLQYFKIQTTTSGNCVGASAPGAYIVIGTNMNFGAAASYHMAASSGGTIYCLSNYTISGGAVDHVLAYAGAAIFSGCTVTVSGTPAFSGVFADAQSLGGVTAFSMTYSGSATGKRYSAVTNSIIQTGGGGANYFPGNSAGTTATGGIYA